MYKLCRIDIGKSKEIYEELKRFSTLLKEKYKAKVYLYGSFAKGDFNETSDIDLIIVGDFSGRMHERVKRILDMTLLPIEPLVYTEKEFEKMKEKTFIKEILKNSVEL